MSTVCTLVSLFVRIELHSQRVVFTFQRSQTQGLVPQMKQAETTGFSLIIHTNGFRWKSRRAEEQQVRTEAQSAPTYFSSRTPSDRRTLFRPQGQVDCHYTLPITFSFVHTARLCMHLWS